MTDDNVFPLTVVPKEDDRVFDPSVKQRLDELMEKYEEGQLKAVAIVYISVGDTTGHGWSDQADAVAMIGGLQRCSHRINLLIDAENGTH